MTAISAIWIGTLKCAADRAGRKPNVKLDRENLQALPYALVGLAIGIGEVLIKPFVMEEVEKARHVAAASIQYFNTGEPK